MKNTILLLTITALPSFAVPGDPRIPETWFQDVTATDGSTQQSIVFTTTPAIRSTKPSRANSHPPVRKYHHTVIIRYGGRHGRRLAVT